MESMGPRWKGKGCEGIALSDPMSVIVSKLRASLLQSETYGLLLGQSVLLEASPEQADLLNRACFGRPIVSAEKDKQQFQLGLEEAFYLFHHLKCLRVVDEDKCLLEEGELLESMVLRVKSFPCLYKAYSHLRSKNWVVRSGSQYGVDFVVYRHHPALVHSEYAALVLSEDGENNRLKVWSDYYCTLRLCGSVAKTLLVLHVNNNGINDQVPSCLEQYTVEEQIIKRWRPEQCRECTQ